MGFEPTISAGERPQTYDLDRAATGTGILSYYWVLYINYSKYHGRKELLINQHYTYFMAGPDNRNLRELLDASINSLHEEDSEIQLLSGTRNVKTITK